jgi:hypothetical protein
MGGASGAAALLKRYVPFRKMLKAGRFPKQSETAAALSFDRHDGQNGSPSSFRKAAAIFDHDGI